MGEHWRGAHTVFEIHLHLVWITKYRRLALTEEMATRVRDLIRDICGQHEVAIMKEARVEGPCASIDLAATAGDDQPADTVAEGPNGASSAGGISTPEEAVLGAALVGPGYFCCSSGNVTDDVIAKYIAEQNTDQDEDFKVDG